MHSELTPAQIHKMTHPELVELFKREPDFLADKGNASACSRHSDEKVILEVASHPKTHPDILRELTNKESLTIRTKVALNPNTHPAVLEELTEHEPEIVRAVAQNPNIPGHMLAQLAEHKDREVRRNVAMHPNSPLETLAQLYWEFENEVNQNPGPKTRRSEFIKLLTSTLPNAKVLAITSIKDHDTLRELAKDKDKIVLAGIAFHPNAPRDLLEKILRENQNDATILTYLMHNKNNPPDIRERAKQRLDELASRERQD